jgi:hypothetical protein
MLINNTKEVTFLLVTKATAFKISHWSKMPKDSLVNLL